MTGGWRRGLIYFQHFLAAALGLGSIVGGFFDGIALGTVIFHSFFRLSVRRFGGATTLAHLCISLCKFSKNNSARCCLKKGLQGGLVSGFSGQHGKPAAGRKSESAAAVFQNLRAKPPQGNWLTPRPAFRIGRRPPIPGPATHSGAEEGIPRKRAWDRGCPACPPGLQSRLWRRRSPS